METVTIAGKVHIRCIDGTLQPTDNNENQHRLLQALIAGNYATGGPTEETIEIAGISFRIRSAEAYSRWGASHRRTTITANGRRIAWRAAVDLLA